MNKINFVNGQAPYINDTNLNQMQTNIENAIEGYDMYKANSGGTENQYCLVAEYTLGSLYSDFSDTIIFNRSVGVWDGRLSSVIINISGRYHSSDTILCTINYMTSYVNAKDYDLYGVTNLIDGVGKVKIYIKNNARYMDIYGKSIDFKSGGATRTYYTNQPNISALPSGTRIVAQETVTSYSKTDDLNAINSHICVSNPNASNRPSSFSGNACMVLDMAGTSGSLYNVQLAFNFGDDKIAIRRKSNSSTWTNWKYTTLS